MTQEEFDARTNELERMIAAEDAGKKSHLLSLAQKIEHNRERNRLRLVLQEHKLNYFELVRRNFLFFND